MTLIQGLVVVMFDCWSLGVLFGGVTLLIVVGGLC